MTRFSAQLQTFAIKTHSNAEAVVTSVTDTVYSELINGGQLSGAPGQPHDLRDKFEVTRGSLTSTIVTSDKSARSVEDGVSHKHGVPLTKLKSPLGGFHSLALILAARQAIIDNAVRKVADNG